MRPFGYVVEVILGEYIEVSCTCLRVSGMYVLRGRDMNLRCSKRGGKKKMSWEEGRRKSARTFGLRKAKIALALLLDPRLPFGAHTKSP